MVAADCTFLFSASAAVLLTASANLLTGEAPQFLRAPDRFMPSGHPSITGECGHVQVQLESHQFGHPLEQHMAPDSGRAPEAWASTP